MDYVEKIVIDKIKEILQNFNKKSEIITKIVEKLKDEKCTNRYIKEFKSNMIITREILIKLINKIEIDKNKQIYIFFRFKQE